MPSKCSPWPQRQPENRKPVFGTSLHIALPIVFRNFRNAITNTRKSDTHTAPFPVGWALAAHASQTKGSLKTENPLSGCPRKPNTPKGHPPC
nr:hypothetical protein [uncultured Kingella sp.]